MIARTVIGIAALLASAGCAGTPSAASDQTVFGHRLAQRYCGECHGIDRGQTSPFDLAPRFPDLYRRYPVQQLAHDLPRHMTDQHPHMSDMDLGPDEVAAITAYLNSFRPASLPGSKARD